MKLVIKNINMYNEHMLRGNLGIGGFTTNALETIADTVGYIEISDINLVETPEKIMKMMKALSEDGFVLEVTNDSELEITKKVYNIN